MVKGSGKFCGGEFYLLDAGWIVLHLIVDASWGAVTMDMDQFMRAFALPEACLEHLEAVRWKDGVFCPHCGGTEDIRPPYGVRQYRCGGCGRLFNVTTGTIFSDVSDELLPKWFAAIWLDARDSGKIDCFRLSRDVGVAPDIARSMLQRIRRASATDTPEGCLGAIGEDVRGDAFHGGAEDRRGNRGGSSHAGRGGGGRRFSITLGGSGVETNMYALCGQTAKAGELIPCAFCNIRIGPFPLVEKVWINFARRNFPLWRFGAQISPASVARKSQNFLRVRGWKFGNFGHNLTRKSGYKVPGSRLFAVENGNSLRGAAHRSLPRYSEFFRLSARF